MRWAVIIGLFLITQTSSGKDAMKCEDMLKRLSIADMQTDFELCVIKNKPKCENAKTNTCPENIALGCLEKAVKKYYKNIKSIQKNRCHLNHG